MKRTISAQLHFVAAIFAAYGVWYLLQITKGMSDRSQFWGCVAYGIPAVLVFSASSIFHLFVDGYDTDPKFERLLRRMDHSAIYLFMAGCYTPVILNVIAPEKRVLFLLLVWISAAAGLAYSLFKTRLPIWAQHRFFSTALYISMGWLITIRFSEFVRDMTTDQLHALLLGCAAYLIGAAIYASKRPKFIEGVFGFHEMWHVTVMVGFVCHYIMILTFYV
jgi:hemolysin III